jgi:sec-independent protein translocase protein TatC
MARTFRPIGHEDRLSLVEHLDELRTRLVICVLVFGVAFGICVWQNHTLLDIVNRPLEKTTHSAAQKSSGGRLEQTARFQTLLRRSLEEEQAAFSRLARASSSLTAADRAALARAAAAQKRALDALPTDTPKRQPVTLGVGEPFTTTLTVSGWFALLFSLPLLLYQLYAFVLPAFSPYERRVALPLLMMVPFLFISGVVFGYFVVLPPAVRFLQNFNNTSFDVLVQAKDYYRFSVMALLGLGILFQMPIVILALTRLGIMTPRQLRANRRYAVLVIAVVAMLLPGTDPVTMLLSMLPLLVLYELSIVLAAILDRRRASAEALDEAEDGFDDDFDEPEDPDDAPEQLSTTRTDPLDDPFD